MFLPNELDRPTVTLIGLVHNRLSESGIRWFQLVWGMLSLGFALPVAESAPMADPSVSSPDDFFTIESLTVHEEPPAPSVGVFTTTKNPDGKSVHAFHPCVEVRVTVEASIDASQVTPKLYIFDRSSKTQIAVLEPSEANRGDKAMKGKWDEPPLYRRGFAESLFFELPEKTNPDQVRFIATFGDKYSVAAKLVPHDTVKFYDFPESRISEVAHKEVDKRRLVDVGLIEHVVKTEHPKVSQITLLVRKPTSAASLEDVDGVMAMCILANSVDSIRQKLLKLDVGGELAGTMAYAEAHNLAIVAWGSATIWQRSTNNSDLTPEEHAEMDEALSVVADAWASGIDELHREYGLPNRNLLLKGACGAGQWAHRIALRQSKYFLAVHSHLAGSFDIPTEGGRHLLWMITTGERDGGYANSVEFFRECKESGYSMIYKAFPNVGHSVGVERRLEELFLDFARTQIEQREMIASGELFDLNQPSFRRSEMEDLRPLYPVLSEAGWYGDIVNQEMFPAAQRDMIPEGFRCPLPTKQIADLWESYDISYSLR